MYLTEQTYTYDVNGKHPKYSLHNVVRERWYQGRLWLQINSRGPLTGVTREGKPVTVQGQFITTWMLVNGDGYTGTMAGRPIFTMRQIPNY